MDYLKVSIDTKSENIESLTGLLYSIGVVSLEIEDESDFRKFLKTNREYWDYVDEDLEKSMTGLCRINVYLPQNDEGRGLIARIQSALKEAKNENGEPLGKENFTCDTVRTEDWANNWKKYFKPIRVGNKLLIKPLWENVENTEGLTVIETDPGMSFGSGQHETTRLCAEAIEKILKQDDTFLDIGCGSGILSVAALLLGAKNAFAIDIDSDAVKTAYKNVEMNHIEKERFFGVCANILNDQNLRDELSDKKFKVIAANIVADVIIPLSKYVPDFLDEGGTYIASGIIYTRIDEVKEAILNNGFNIVEIKKDNDWYSIISTR